MPIAPPLEPPKICAFPNANHMVKNRSNPNDVQKLVFDAERHGWRVEEIRNEYGYVISLSSPVGKYGDWATISVMADSRGRNSRILTRRNYHKANEGDRGLFSAQQVLKDDEQWRYSRKGIVK